MSGFSDVIHQCCQQTPYFSTNYVWQFFALCEAAAGISSYSANLSYFLFLSREVRTECQSPKSHHTTSCRLSKPTLQILYFFFAVYFISNVNSVYCTLSFLIMMLLYSSFYHKISPITQNKEVSLPTLKYKHSPYRTFIHTFFLFLGLSLHGF